MLSAIRLPLCAAALLAFTGQSSSILAQGSGSLTPESTFTRMGGETFEEVYRVTEKGGGLGLTIDQTVIFRAAHRSASPPYWIAERNNRVDNFCGRRDAQARCVATVKIEHDWANSTACPSLISSLNDLEKLPAPGFASPGTPHVVAVADGVFVQVTGTMGGQGGMGARIAYGAYSGPIVTWWKNTEAHLKDCWKAAPS